MKLISTCHFLKLSKVVCELPEQNHTKSLFDNNQISLDNSTTYPNSPVAGANFSFFKISTTATTDTVLGLKIKIGIDRELVRDLKTI